MKNFEELLKEIKNIAKSITVDEFRKCLKEFEEIDKNRSGTNDSQM